MKIHADPTTDGAGIALDVDHPHTLQTFGPDFIPRGVVLTVDEAAELRNELTRALDKIAPKTRTPADVLTDPQPGDSIEWSDGTLWLVVEVSDAGDDVTFDEVGEDGESVERVVMPLYIWMPSFPASEGVCIPASDVPPPTP